MKNLFKNIISKIKPQNDILTDTSPQQEAVQDSSTIPLQQQSLEAKANLPINNFGFFLTRIKPLIPVIVGILGTFLIIRFISGISGLLLSSSIVSMKLIIVLLVLLIVAIILYLKRPALLKKIIEKIKVKLPILGGHAKKHYDTVNNHAVNWLERFRQANGKQRFLMVRKQLLFLVVVLLVFNFGNLFLPPNIATSFPGNKTIEAPLDSKIEIIFNKGVIKSSVEKGFFVSPMVDGNYAWEGDQKFVFTPKKRLDRAKEYKVSFKGIILSKFFIPLIGNTTINFETIGNPKIVVASPLAEAPEDLTPITVVFDRPMIPLTTATNTTLKLPAFTITPEIKGEGRWLGTTAYQFRPTQSYKKATTFKVTVAAGLRSQDGGVLQNEYVWQFSSVRPRVADISPKYGYEYASPTASVSAIFNQNIDLQSISDKFIIYDKNNNKVPGRVVVSGNVVGFYSFLPLTRKENYKAVIKAGVKSLEGENGMEDDYSWPFKVVDTPGIISSDPINGAKDIKEQYRAEVVFRTPMDESSFENNVMIDPNPDIKPSLYFSSYNNTLSISSYFGRSQQYTITISSQVKDQYGVPLGKEYKFTFNTSAYSPSVSISPSGTYFGAFNQQIVPRVVSQVINANKVNYTLYKLKREDLLDLYRKRYDYYACGNDSDCRTWQNYDPSKLEKVRVWSETFEADKNTPVTVVTKITNNNGDKIPAGFYYLDLHIPQGPHDNMVMIVSKSTLTVKKSDKQIFSWAVNQFSGSVVSGMKMQLTDSSGNVLSEGLTNNDGVFMKDANLFQKNDLFVFGQKDDDIVVAASAWGQGITTYDFGLPSYYNYNESKDYTQQQNYKIFTTIDRPIFRPGQKVYFKGIIKKDNDGAYENLGPGTEVLVTISDANNRSVYSKSIPITTFGSFSGDFVLSKDASLGYYQVKSAFSGNSYNQSFQVEEYKKPELAVVVNTSKTAYTQGEIADVAINASYYFGSPVTNAPTTWTLQTQDDSFRWDKDWRFEFGDPDSYWSRPWWNYSGSSYYSGKVVTTGSGKTDAKGNLELNLPLNISSYKTSQKMMVEAVVNDVSNQSIAGSQEFTVHKANYYAGLRPESYANQTGQETKVEIVTIDVNGKEVANLPVSVEFYKRTWETVREQNPDDGLFYYTSKPSDALVSSTSVTTDSLGRVVASFTPTEGGTYKVVSRVTDKSGNQNVSGSFLWVSGWGFSAERANNDRIVVVTDKRDYLVGENMSIFVASPFASASAKTLLTVERGSVLDYKVVDTNDSSNNFPLSIASKYAPNAFIGAVLVKPGDQVKNPAEFKIGYTEVKVTDKKQQINVKITTDKLRYKPKDTLKATIETKDLLGNPVSSEIAVGLVDKAVWDLANVELPDIYKTFYQPRNLEVQNSQLLTISIDRINANTNLGAKGGSGGGCFTGETPILMVGGVYKNIKDIKVGDFVLTRESENSSKLVKAKVLKTFKHIVSDYLILNGELRVTSIHKMYINGKWITAGEALIGDYLLDKNNNPMRIFSIESVRGKFEVYNLETEKYHTYFARDIYVHNQKGPGNDTSRADFKDTAYWNPSVKTDKDGVAHLEIKLPDNLTTWRLAAIANSQESAFGSQKAEVLVSRDLLIRPFIPRFLAVGDQSQLGGIIVNTSGQSQAITARIEGIGIAINDNPVQKQVIADGGQVRLTWNTVAKDAKTATIKLSVQNEDNSVKDAVEVSLPIKSYSVPEVVATAGEVKGTAQEKIVLPKEVDPTQGQASVTLSPSLGSASFNSLAYLYDYPYYCVEQVTSRLLPSLFINQILKNAKIDKSGDVNTKDLELVISDEVQRLNNSQHPDGGWGWWIEYESNPYLSAYAFLGLKEAKKDGYAVSDQTLQKAQSFLTNILSRGEKAASLNTQAFILNVLRGRGINLSSYASILYDRRFELSLQARSYLSMSMKDMGMQSQAKRIYDELISLAKKTATTTHWEESKIDYYSMGSNISATAAILETLLEFDKKNPLIPEIIRYFMTSRTDGHWGSTYDTAAVIKAISMQLYGNSDQNLNEDYRLLLNGKILTSGKFTKEDLLSLKTYLITISKFNIGGENKLQVVKSGEGSLYYNVNLKYYLPFSEIKPLEQGMVVIREFVDDKGRVLPNDSIAQNSEAWIRLMIVAPEERHFVAIEDTLPAGLESVNESLKNVAVLNKDGPGVKSKGNQILFFAHKEYHDDKTTLFADYLPAGVYEVSYRVRATTPGRYHHPPAQAYQMYVPDVSGHSDGGWLEVK